MSGLLSNYQSADLALSEVDACLQKPYTIEALIQEIQGILKIGALTNALENC